MHNASGKVTAYLRFLPDRFASPARIERTSWLIAQRLHEVSTVFQGAPIAWASTLEHGRPENFQHDFTATLHHRVSGISWLEIKAETERKGKSLPSMTARVAIAKNFIAQLATYETYGNGFVHGDPSPGNLLIDLHTNEVCLIDCDAFVYLHSDTLRFPELSIGNGGIKGTPGYMPIDLEKNTSPDAVPYSDRFGRDQILLELLAMHPGDPIDESPASWNDRDLTLQRVRPIAKELGLPHLADLSVFSAAENERPTSRELAIAVGCRMPVVKRTPQRRSYFKKTLTAQEKVPFTFEMFTALCMLVFAVFIVFTLICKVLAG